MDVKRSSAGFTQISPKTLHYFSNGTGRDGYIATNCGGLIAPMEVKTAFELGIMIHSPNCQVLSHRKSRFERRVQELIRKEYTITQTEQAAMAILRKLALCFLYK